VPCWPRRVIGRPSVIIMDEPLEAMDRGTQDVIIQWVDRLLSEDATIVVATHEIEPFVARRRGR